MNKYDSHPYRATGYHSAYLSSWKLNVLSFGEDEASSMGVQVSRLRFIVILSATLLTATVVSITGLIGWIGLVVPHIARFLHRLG